MTKSDQIPERNKLAWLKTIAILLFGLLAGAALIYLAQPPKPAPGSLLYEMHIFTSDERVEDFSPHVQMLQYNAAQNVRLVSGGGIVGNLNFSAEPGMLTQFSLALPKANSPYQSLTGLQIELRGDPMRDRIRTSLNIETDYAIASHRLEQGEGEYRVIEVITGEKDRQKWCYAIVLVQPAKATTPTVFGNPVPAGADTQVAPLPE